MDKISEPATFIAPTIGRKVWYWPSSGDPIGAMSVIDPEKPFDATIVYVTSDRYVNLLIIDHEGQLHQRHAVWLSQAGEDAAPLPYAEWMPYQKGQAAKSAPVVLGELPMPKLPLVELIRQIAAATLRTESEIVDETVLVGRAMMRVQVGLMPGAGG